MPNIEILHKHFHAEVTTASQAFFLWKGINNSAANDRNIYAGLNEHALSWNIITYALQNTFFIALGRLFDTDGDAFSVHAFLRSCIASLNQFSRKALRDRKVHTTGDSVPDWLDDYVRDAYEAQEKDFQILRGELSKQEKQYEDIYRPIRNKVMAHKDTATLENVDTLFEKTDVGQIERFLWFLHQIDNIVFKLLYNGRLSAVGDYEFREEQFVVNDVRMILEKLKA